MTEALKNIKILYVEDDPSVRGALSAIIKRRVETLITAEDGEDGYQKYLEHLPDIIITDIKMPIMDGIEMSKKIREHSKNIPIIITTAFSDTEFLLDAINIGINRFVLKPIDSRKLFESLEKSAKEITYEARLEKSYAELSKNLKMLTEYKNAVEAGAMASITDPNGVIISVNDEFCDFTGYSKDELIGKTHDVIRHKDFNLEPEKKIAQAKEKNEIFKGLLRGIKKTGEDFYVNLTIIPILDENHTVVEYVELRNNVTGLIRQIYTDPLTGFPNRSALLKDIEKIDDVLLYLINIDSFKDINDFYGNVAGDDMLIQITKYLNEFTNENIESGILYKLSGDEFAILLKNRVDSHALAKNINDTFENNDFYINDTDIKLNVSIGYSSTKVNLIANADMALKYAKANRIDTACFEDVSHVANDHERNITCTKKLKNAILNDDILPFFQPIIDNSSGKIVKYEALIRMKDNDKIISPFYFLETAVKAKQYHKLTKIMIDKSFEYFKNLDYGFSLNISASDILRAETKDYLINKIKEFNIGSKLIIEILESEEFEKYDVILKFIQEVKSYGCLIAIDDFGSGYSNFQHIINLKVDFIKIDGSLIKNIIVDENSRRVVKTIANIAKELEVKTVAEFVHSIEVQNKILEIGIDYSQGYYFGEPKPAII